MSDIKRTVIWSADTVQPSNTSITLNDSIDNYDEIIYYGSATRTYCPCVMTEYPVISGVLNLGGPLFIGKWGSTDGFVLCNGTQVFLSGTSGFVASSYFWGKNASNTDYAASLVTNRTEDVRPYMIVGVKYPDNYDRTLIWSSEHTAQLYNTTITLDETVNHFDEIMVLGSGFENGGVGCRHASKNIYNVQDKVMGCDAWAYTPWKLAEKHNLIIGQEMRISGNSGYIGSGYFMGMGNQTNAWAAGKWNADYQFSATAPYAIYGLKRRPTYKFKAISSPGGSVSSNINPGYSGDIATITVTPAGDEWKQSALNITGATLTGNDFMFGNSNVSAQAEFEHSRDLTLVPNEHATLSADKMSGFSGDVVTVDATTDEGWYFTGLNVTGATATGNQFMFVGNDVTAEGLYTDAGYPITYIVETGGTLSGDQLYIPGSTGITLQTAYDTYYRFSGYEVTGGTITDNVLVAEGPCTAKAVYKVNYFTATGNFDFATGAAWAGVASWSRNCDGKIRARTGSLPDGWGANGSNFNPSDASSYKINWNTTLYFQSNNLNKGSKAMTGYNRIYCGSTNVKTTTCTIAGSKTGNYAKANTNNNGNSTIQGHPYMNAAIGSTTSRVQMDCNSCSPNGWTATGIAP